QIRPKDKVVGSTPARGTIDMTEKIAKQFDGQRDDEELLFVFRRHIIAMRKGFYLLLVPMALGALPFLIWQNNLNLLWVFLGSFLFGLVLFFYHFLMWFYTYYLVTNQRIRQITQRGFFGKDVVELKLAKVQNISYNVPGFAGEMFKFGTIVIQTFVGDLVIKNVEHPDEIYNKLQDAVDMATQRSEHDQEDIEA
ncbi:MAG: PH domain-containing protein, partial [Candidatus Saccharibacteria bacterium]|nr:PH domain-containing protein [Candidatus Saccharibacteria bacterium]